MNNRIANDLIRYAELVEDGALISPEEMNCASLMRLAAEALMSFQDGAQPEQEPVAWRYKPAREDNPRWEYTTNHPLDMGDGYIRPSLVEYCKCIEPLYAKEKPKLMLEKFREMEDLLEEPAQQEPATKEKIREAIVFNLPLYTTPYVATPRPQRTWVGLTDEEKADLFAGTAPYYNEADYANAIEAKLKAKNERKEKNTCNGGCL